MKFAGILGIPPRSGKLRNLDLFDASFFGVGEKQADATDPQFRIILETAYEAIVDAGNERICIIANNNPVTLVMLQSKTF